MYNGLSCISSFWLGFDVFTIPLQLLLSASIPKAIAFSEFNSEMDEGLFQGKNKGQIFISWSGSFWILSAVSGPSKKEGTDCGPHFGTLSQHWIVHVARTKHLLNGIRAHVYDAWVSFLVLHWCMSLQEMSNMQSNHMAWLTFTHTVAVYIDQVGHQLFKSLICIC